MSNDFRKIPRKWFWGVAAALLLAIVAVWGKAAGDAERNREAEETEAVAPDIPATIDEEELARKAKERLPEAATIRMLREMQRRLQSKVQANPSAIPSPEQAAVEQHLRELPLLIQKAEAGLLKTDRESYPKALRPLIRRKREAMIGGELPAVIAKTKVKMQESLSKITAEQYPEEAQAGIKVLIATLDEMAGP